MPSCLSMNKTRIMQDIFLEFSPESPNNPKRLVVVMDPLKEFEVELLEWVLKNFSFGNGCFITLLGVTPWLNIPLYSKTWSDIWSMDMEDLSTFPDKNDFKLDPRYHKVQRLIDLCQNYGVVPEIKTEMGHPLRLKVVEQISTLHATLVVFDRYHDRKNIEFYVEKIPCMMVVVNDNGDVELIKKRKRNGSESENTPCTESLASRSSRTMSGQLTKCLKQKFQGKLDKDSK